MIKLLHLRRRRLSFLMANVAVSVVTFVVVLLPGYLFPASVFGRNGNVFDKIECVFSKSWVLGVIFELVYVIAGGFIFIINTQRLRDMGCRIPVFISMVLLVLNFISSSFSWLVGVNFISIAIEVGLIVFFLIMLFTSSKECS